ncbi:hypothetical protein ACTFIW_012571 [Dictyostelium discoideum]
MNKEIFNSKLFEKLDKDNLIENSREWSNEIDSTWNYNDVVGILKSWESLNTISLEYIDSIINCLTEIGKDILINGSPEAKLYNILTEQGMSPADANKQFGATAFGSAKNKGWIEVKSGKIFKKVESINDIVKSDLSISDLNKLDSKTLEQYKKSRFIEEKKLSYYRVTKGEQYNKRSKELSDLTIEMLKDDSWEKESFKVNINAMGVVPEQGYRHPLNKVKNEFKQIFLDMGFEEMPTFNFVENGFWNFDALFQPQQHPARELQDTFFIKDPKTSHDFSDEYCERVKQVHSVGGYGSLGWIYDWKLEEAEKNILRTHTTAVSARMLYKLAQNGFKPKKYFSIDRVFRNETLDATHLAEFHQVEGVIADVDISLGHLIGVISEFFKRLGIDNVRFKPAFNPYTEPSMEIFGYHPILKRWVELGNSGIFRPELLLPMGIPENVRVAAWGLSLERPTMIKYGLDNIRAIFGNSINVNFIKNNPICMFESK